MMPVVEVFNLREAAIAPSSESADSSPPTLYSLRLNPFHSILPFTSSYYASILVYRCVDVSVGYIAFRDMSISPSQYYIVASCYTVLFHKF
jgi:hypothetical protein